MLLIGRSIGSLKMGPNYGVARQTTGCSSQAMWSIALVNYSSTITLITHAPSHILNKSVLSPTHIYVESTLGGTFFSIDIKDRR